MHIIYSSHRIAIFPILATPLFSTLVSKIRRLRIQAGPILGNTHKLITLVPINMKPDVPGSL